MEQTPERHHIPDTCPPGFRRYTVMSGDTMFLIARRFGVPLDRLIAANPHIANPDLIYPGDVVCIPERGLRFPCCVVLRVPHPPPEFRPDPWGAALIMQPAADQHAVSILTVGLPPPYTLGRFNIYEGVVKIPGVDSFEFRLFPTPEKPPTRAGTLVIKPLLTPDTEVIVRPANWKICASGPTVLAGTLEQCALMLDPPETG
ncbi:MAG: LysM peptidoglycan-binding domain-containing protein [Bacillota bacterium]